MKKLAFILMLAILLAGGVGAAISTPSYAQFYEYTSPPPDPYAQPWVGPGTPWVYYNGDWFLNGLLYLFFGPQYGWAPYYAYPPIYIVRPVRFYAPFYLNWYSNHPVVVERFVSSYPYWRSHRQGQHYDQKFYEQHHRGQGGGWQQGFHGRPAAPPHPEGLKPGAAPGPAHVAPPAGPRPGPAQAPHPEGRRPGAPPEGPKPGPAPGPAQVAPPAAPHPGPAQVAPAGPKPAPAPAPKPAPAIKPAPAPAPAAPGAPQPEKGGHGEEKH